MHVAEGMTGIYQSRCGGPCSHTEHERRGRIVFLIVWKDDELPYPVLWKLLTDIRVSPVLSTTHSTVFGCLCQDDALHKVLKPSAMDFCYES